MVTCILFFPQERIPAGPFPLLHFRYILQKFFTDSASALDHPTFADKFRQEAERVLKLKPLSSFQKLPATQLNKLIALSSEVRT